MSKHSCKDNNHWLMQSQSRTSDFGLLQKDRSRVQSRLITRSTCQFAYPKVPTTTGFYAISHPRVKNHILTCKWQYMGKVISFINFNQRNSRKRSLKNKAVTWLEHLLLRITSWLILSTKIISHIVTLVSDQDIISPYNIDTISSWQVRRMKKI